MLIGLTLLFGFAPQGDSVQVGPDSAHLDQTSLQNVLAQREVALDNAVGGTWAVRWDERNATPRAVVGSGVNLGEADLLVHTIAGMGGVDADDLRRERQLTRGVKESVRYQQYYRGAPVEGATIDAFAKLGRVTYVLANLHRPNLDSEPRAGEVILPKWTGDRFEYELVIKTQQGDDIVFIGRDGSEVHRYTLRYHLDVQTHSRTFMDPVVVVPARDVFVTDGVNDAWTDEQGDHPFSGGSYGAALDGRNVRILSNYQAVVVEDVKDDLLVGGEDISKGAASMAYHFHIVRDWLDSYNTTSSLLNRTVRATVDITSGNCNAYYTQATLNFYAAGGGCNNMAEIADVIYHEYGHGVHEYQLMGGVFAGDISEGSADYVSATITGSPVIGPGSFGQSGYIREIDTDRKYPRDAIGQVHNDGQIWGSMLWNIRQDWEAARGEAGVQQLDQLVLDTLTYGPTLTDMTEAVLAADDDDGDLSNGTPNGCELVGYLNDHGLGPGPMGVIKYRHSPLDDQPSGRTPYGGSLKLEQVIPACTDLDPESVTVHWVANPEPVLRVRDLTFNSIPALMDADGNFGFEIPAQPAGSRILYYVTWQDANGETVENSHGGSMAGLHEFFVGDTEELWCDDFENGGENWMFLRGDSSSQPSENTQWEIGEPSGRKEAPSGAQILATNIGGEYRANLEQTAMSIPIDFSDAVPALTLLEYKRWLRVENSEYDYAIVEAIGDGQVSELWRNPREADLLDRDWTTMTHDLSRLAGKEKGQVAFYLGSDGGLEYDGWSLDDVCVMTLSDPIGHYTAQGIAAEISDAGTELSWEQPFVVPLVEVAVVRNQRGYPTTIEDGDLIHSDTEPVPGELTTFMDDGADGTGYYAVFASDGEGRWYQVATEGENAIHPANAEGGPGLEKAGGCGCASNSALSFGWLLLPLLGLVRRRR